MKTRRRTVSASFISPRLVTCRTVISDIDASIRRFATIWPTEVAMKVTSYVIDCVRVPTEEAITGSHLVLRLRTDNGLEGFGYVSRLRDDALKTCAALVQRYLDDAIVGEDPRDTERLFAKLWRRGGGLPGYVERAASVIDVALWDLKARAAGQPLWQALGGFRNRVDCYASWRLEPAEDLGGPAARRGQAL